jgi:hypothetical protein
MKETGTVLIGLSHELTIYLRQHPEELPSGIDKDSLVVVCSSYLIDNIENYIFAPYKDKFLWRVKFKNSSFPEYEYMYFITYKAVCNAQKGIVEVKLIQEKRETNTPFHRYN